MSPSSTLRTYWTALRDGNAGEAWECFVEGRYDLPRPGMLWFLPPSDLTLAEFRSLPVSRGRILVSYEVRYRPVGSDDTLRFRSADELVRPARRVAHRAPDRRCHHAAVASDPAIG
jgi:hypothetical protein